MEKINLPAASSGVSSGRQGMEALTQEESSSQAAGNLTRPGLKQR